MRGRTALLFFFFASGWASAALLDAGLETTCPLLSQDAASREELKPPSRNDPPFAKTQPLPPEADLLARATRNNTGTLEVQRDGHLEPLTIDSSLQTKMVALLRSHQTPYAAVVVIEPSTGRVLTMAEHSEANPSMRGLCTKAIYPAASIFKVITTGALLASGVPPDAPICYRGGKRRLTEKLLIDSNADGRCCTLSEAFAQSANVPFAKLTQRNLSADKLRAVAESFGFNRPFPFPIPTEMSSANIPEEPFALSNTGAGFGDVFLSPLHAAQMACVLANGGVWHWPRLFETDVNTPHPGDGERILDEQHAHMLTAMMEETVVAGTARRVFRQRGFQVMGAVGKTGSLADKKPYRDYSWFVGFAPKENAKVAVAAIVVNDYVWRIHAPFLAREAMRLYLETKR